MGNIDSTNYSSTTSSNSGITSSNLVLNTPIVLTIAGSDSGGGAGIQADIKAISATGSYACSVITALTAQNTCGVQAVYPIEPSFIERQCDAVFSDLAIDAVKIGMLGDVATIKAVAKAIKKHSPKCVVLDPVMVATSGDLLLEKNAISTLIDELLPLADIITPNMPEALALLGMDTKDIPESPQQVLSIARQILALGCQSVLVKGGHQSGSLSLDYWVSADSEHSFSAERIATQNTHGTGCTLSSSIASYLAQEQSLYQAIEQAKSYITQAIACADQLNIGSGSGPVHHFYQLTTK